MAAQQSGTTSICMHPKSLCYLPLAHYIQRWWTCGVARPWVKPSTRSVEKKQIVCWALHVKLACISCSAVSTLSLNTLMAHPAGRLGLYFIWASNRVSLRHALTNVALASAAQVASSPFASGPVCFTMCLSYVKHLVAPSANAQCPTGASKDRRMECSCLLFAKLIRHWWWKPCLQQSALRWAWNSSTKSRCNCTIDIGQWKFIPNIQNHALEEKT